MDRKCDVAAGIAGVANEGPPRTGSTFTDSFSSSQQYPAYPVLTPSRSGGGQDHGSAYQAPDSGGYGGYGQSSSSYQQPSRPQSQQQGYKSSSGYGQQSSYQQPAYGGSAGSGYQSQAPQVSLNIHKEEAGKGSGAPDAPYMNGSSDMSPFFVQEGSWLF